MGRYADDTLLLEGDLDEATVATGRTRFVLERQGDGTWLFGAPSMLSYSPRPGDMVADETALQAMRAWIEANREGVDDER